MKITTGHTTFDKQTNYIGKGNVAAPTQFGSFIRPFSQTECNGCENKPGELQNFDLKAFVDALHVPKCVIDEVREQKEQVILYAFFHKTKGLRRLDGCILTTEDYKFIKSWVFHGSYKGCQIIGTCQKIVCEG